MIIILVQLPLVQLLYKRSLISRKNAVTVRCNVEHTNALDTTKMLHHMCMQLAEIQNRKHLFVTHLNKHITH